MQRIFYCAGTSFITSDDVATSLLRYARELIASDRTAVVNVPLIRSDGTGGGVDLLLTPTTQLASEAMRAPYTGSGEAVFLSELTEKIALLQTPPTPRMEIMKAPAFPEFH